jgi:hypothetical protein
MPIKLTAIPKKTKKVTYQVIVEMMHGDADLTERQTITCKDEADFVKKMTAVKTQPMGGSEGGDEDEYAKWCEENFSDYISFDKIFSGTSNRAKVQSVEGFFYDEHGMKWKAEVTA